MKILATSDWHLGSYVGPQCDDPMKRMENTMRCLDVLVETAKREQPDIILVSGDIFHSSKVWDERRLIEIRVAADYIRALSFVAPVAVLYGTPSHENLQSFYTLEEIVYKSSNETFFFTQPSLREFQTKSGPIQIAGLPGFDKGHFRAQFPGLSAEEENQVFTQQLAQVVQGLSAQVNSTIPSVLMAHHTVVGCDMGNGTHIFQANEVVLDAATLDNSNFDLVCLGHIHKAQKVKSCNKPVYYSGSIDANTFNDEGHEKGFYVHTVDKFTPRDTFSFFYKTPAREFITDYWDDEDVEEYMKKGLFEHSGSIEKNDYKNKVVRVLYTCDSETEKALDKKKLERDLYAAGAHYVSEIRSEKITAAVNRDRMHEKMTVESCLQRYLEEKKKTPEEMTQLLELSLGIIAQAQASSPIGATSGLFLPVEIEVRNYRSYVEEKLSFEDIFFAMVNGKNGSGKSSLFMDAITDCLYEETREKELTGWIRNGEKSGSISFTFKLGDDTWRVTRTRQRSGKATLALAKWYYKDKPGELCFGIWKDHSGKCFTDTQQKIIDLLGMDCDTFQSCVLIMQDRYGKFMEASKEDRMNVLASLLGLGIYEELEKLAKEKLTDINRGIKTLKGEIEKLEGDVSTGGDLQTEGAQIEVQLACANNDLKAAREELAVYQAQLVAIEGYAREILELEKDVKSKTDTYTEKKNRKVDLENRVLETESFLMNEKNILDRCAELDSTRLTIAALDGKLQLLNDKKLQWVKLNRDINSIHIQRTSIEVRLDGIKRNLQEREKLEDIVNGNTVEAKLEECEGISLKYQTISSDLKKARTQASNHTEETMSHCRLTGVEMQSLLKQVIMLDGAECIDLDGANCKFLRSAKEAKGKIIVEKKSLDAYELESGKKTVELNNVVENLLNQISELNYNSEKHEDIKKKVKAYREAKDALSKLSADAATADALGKQDVELAARILVYKSELETIGKEIAVLEKETSDLDVLSSRVRDLMQYENHKMQLPKAKQFVESSREQIEQLVSDLSVLTTEIEKVRKRLGELKECIDYENDGMGLRQCIRDDEQTVKVIERDISTLNQQIGSIKAKLEIIEGQKVQMQGKQSELQQSARQAAQLQVLTEAFSQDGIPYQIIRDIVPELEAAANEILGQMTGGRMRLEFVTEKVLKSNKAKEIPTLEIIIIDVDNGILLYLSRSGGQKVRAALANSFALAMIKASRVGLQLGMLFIDEPSFLDADGIEGYCTALETIHNRYPDMRILAISHDENMKQRFPQQLVVEMTEMGSKVRRL